MTTRPAATVLATPGAPLSGLSAWASIVAQCQPFRAGTRFQTLPSVTFDTSAGRVHHPGDLLPRVAEAELGSYHERIQSYGTDVWTIGVNQPWVDDAERWELARDALLQRFDEEGYPVLPVSLDLVATSATSWRAGSEPRGSQLLWVLEGEAEVQLAGTWCNLDRGSGALSVSMGSRLTVHRHPSSGPLVLLLATVSADPRVPVMALAHRVAAVLDSSRSDDAVPYLMATLTASGEPAPVAEQPVLEPLGRARDALLGYFDDPHRIPAARLEWARRVSAAGLEPAPPPRPRRAPPSLDRHTRWVRRARVLFGEDGRGGTVCAANGHAFTVQGNAVRKFLAELNSMSTTSLDELAGAVAGAAATDEVRATIARSLAPMFEQLWRLRAVEELE